MYHFLSHWDKSCRSRNMQVLVLFMSVSCIFENVSNALKLWYKTLVPSINTLPSKIKVLYQFPYNKKSIRKSPVQSFRALPSISWRYPRSETHSPQPPWLIQALSPPVKQKRQVFALVLTAVFSSFFPPSHTRQMKFNNSI